MNRETFTPAPREAGHGLNRQQRRAASKFMDEQRAQWSERLRPIPRDQWPETASADGPIGAFRSRDFLVQVFHAPAPADLRLSVNRIALDGNRWQDGITWDDLQRLKAEAGFGEREAVEVYPAAHDVVNVANIRHLWILSEGMPFTWRVGESKLIASATVRISTPTAPSGGHASLGG